MQTNKEKRQLSVHPAIIFDLIKGQAGSLGKAVLECVMNSVDSGSTRVTVDITNRGVNIQDDGRGFQSRKEIEDWFEVFGFPHEEGDGRIYGKFGIGRGQLWSFCSTIWRTNTFEMSVDIKKSGLDYALLENTPNRPGLLIEGSFYQRLTTAELMAFQRELAELARYCPIPVLVNGTQVNKDPAKEKWDFDTPEAWIKLKETGDLAVYNLGVFVRKFPAYHAGSGGVVVTKPGVRLALNMARNDILVSECKVWRKIKPFLQKKSDERIRAKPTRLSEGELENLSRRFLAGEVSFEEVNERRLVTDILGRHHTLRGMIDALGFRGTNRPLTVAPEGSRLGEQAHTTKLAFVLSEKTLSRFDAESVAEFKNKVRKALKAEGANRWLLESLDRISVSESIHKAAASIKEGYLVIPVKEWTEEEKVAIATVKAMATRISLHLRREGVLSHNTAYRQIELGVSDTAAAWTDGSTRIVIERRQLNLLKEGVGGFSGLANLLVHEFLHDTEDTGSHTHDMEFYKRYHDATCAKEGVLNKAVTYGLAAYLRELRRTKRRIPAKLLENLAVIEDLANRPVENEPGPENEALTTAA